MPQAEPSASGGLDLSFFIPPEPLETVLLAGVAPAIVAGAVLAGVWANTGRSNDEPTDGRWRWLAPLAIAAMAIFAEAMMRGWPSPIWQPQVGNRFVILAAAIGAAGVAQALLNRRTKLGWIIGSLLASAAVIGMLAEPRLRPDHAKFTMALVHGLSVVVGITSLSGLLGWAHDRVRGWAVPAAALPAFGLTGPVLVLANTAPAAQLSVLVPATIGASVAAALWWRSLTLSRGGWTVLCAWNVSLVFYNEFWGYNSLSPLGAVLLAIAPLAAVTPALPLLKKLPTPMRVLIGAGLGSGLAMASLVMAFRAAQATSDAYY